MLNVTATVVSTGAEASITIDMVQADLESETRVDVEGWKEAPLAADYRTIIRRAERWLKKHEGDAGHEEDAEELEELLYRLKRAVLEDDGFGAEALEDEIRDLLEV